MKTVIIIARFILGLVFVVFGLNILHPFLPQPPIPDGSLPARFMAVMGPTHWMALAGASPRVRVGSVLPLPTAATEVPVPGPMCATSFVSPILPTGGARHEPVVA